MIGTDALGVCLHRVLTVGEVSTAKDDGVIWLYLHEVLTVS